MEDFGTNNLHRKSDEANCLHEFRSNCFDICYGINQTFEKFRLIHDNGGVSLQNTTGRGERRWPVLGTNAHTHTCGGSSTFGTAVGIDTIKLAWYVSTLKQDLDH